MANAILFGLLNAAAVPRGDLGSTPPSANNLSDSVMNINLSYRHSLNIDKNNNNYKDEIIKF